METVRYLVGVANGEEMHILRDESNLDFRAYRNLQRANKEAQLLSELHTILYAVIEAKYDDDELVDAYEDSPITFWFNGRQMVCKEI